MCFCKAKLHCKLDIFQCFSKDSLAVLEFNVCLYHLELLKLVLSNGYTTDQSLVTSLDCIINDFIYLTLFHAKVAFNSIV